MLMIWRWFLFLGILLLSIVLGLQLKADPGYVLVAYHHTRIEMTVLVAIAFWLMSFLALLLIRQVWCLLARAVYWPGQVRRLIAKKNEQQAYQFLLEGRWAAAEKKALSSAGHRQQSYLSYLIAAISAQQQGESLRCDEYLYQAYAIAPTQAELAVGLTQATLEFEREQYEQVLAVLSRLKEHHPKQPRLLFLLAKTYEKLALWDELQVLLPSLKKVLTKKEGERYEHSVYQALLQRLAPTECQTLWHRLPKTFQHDPSLAVLYVKQLRQLGDVIQAERVLQKVLQRHWSADCLALYIDLPTPRDHAAARCFLEKQREHHPEDALLLYGLGVLCSFGQLWGQARGYFEASLAVQPKQKTYAALGQLLEQLGEKEEAFACYRRATLAATQS